MKVDYKSPNPIIISFPSYAGGKFISNCLSLSKHTCPQDPEAAEYLLKNSDDYDYRLQKVMSTLPPKVKMQNWRSYEFGDSQLYGLDFENWFNYGLSNISAINPITQQLSTSSLKFFITDHSGPPRTNNLLKVWPNATVIRLINYRHFQDICVKLKTQYLTEDLNGNYCIEKYNMLKGDDWPDWNQFDMVGCDIRKIAGVSPEIIEEIQNFYPWHSITKSVVLFDIDSCIFNSTHFLNAMEKLYIELNFDDFNPDRILKFYQAYIELHYKV